ncbi:MAG: FAD-dependent oxidoreductase [Candidatus Saccharibacteria bacterium]
MFKYTVRESSKISASTQLLTLENTSGKHFRFTAGQYAALHFTRHGRRTPVRCFSIVSSPLQSDVLQFAARVTGSFTSSLSALQPGDTVYLQGPYGEFIVDSQDTSLVFIAGGIGITPYMSLLRALTQRQSTMPVTVVYACRDIFDVPFANELRALVRSNPHIHLTFMIGRAGREAQLAADSRRGRIDNEFMDELLSSVSSAATFFVCGPPRLMSSTSAYLLSHGIAGDKLVMEAFGQRKLGAKTNASTAPRRIYSLTAASVILGTALLMISNLVGSAHGSAASQPAAPTTAAPTTSSDNAAAGYAPTATPSTPAASSPMTTQTYQPPMSTVS